MKKSGFNRKIQGFCPLAEMLKVMEPQNKNWTLENTQTRRHKTSQMDTGKPQNKNRTLKKQKPDDSKSANRTPENPLRRPQDAPEPSPRHDQRGPLLYHNFAS